jgi:hypothetical protein
MKVFKLDLMTILVLVVILGVVLTMTSQAATRSASTATKVDVAKVEFAGSVLPATKSRSR